MQIFQPVKVENYQFMDSGLNQYELLLVFILEMMKKMTRYIL